MGEPSINHTLRMDLYSHGIKVSGYDVKIKYLLLEYCRTLAQFGMVPIGHGKFERKMVKVYASATKNKLEFRFHRNQEADLKRHLESYGVPISSMKIVEHPLYEPVTVDFPSIDERVPRDYQIPIIDFFVKPGKTKVVTLQTGKGKSLIFLKAVEQLKQRTMLVIRSMYVTKWIEDIEQSFDIKPGELMVVRGSKALISLINLAKTGELEAKFIIITNKTIFNFIKNYERSNGTDDTYGIAPEALYETLGVGIRGIDEVHLDFHLNFRQDLYTNIPKTISMSATLQSDDRFMNKMYDIVFPAGTHAPQPKHDKYICVRELQYGATEPNKLKHKNVMKQYSHTRFEKSIMRHPKILRNYLSMIGKILKESFLPVREEGQKMVVFCSMKEMCTLVRDYLIATLNEEQGLALKINRYVDEDTYESLLEADIAVTTIQSAGTAVDIPGLRMCLMTTALSSKQTNEQVVGRLRRLKDWPKVTPEFFFLTCRDIRKHVTYGQEKQHKLDGKVLSFNTYQTPYKI